MRKTFISIIALGLAACGGDPHISAPQETDTTHQDTTADATPTTGVFETPYGPMELPYTVVDGKNIVGGDIVMGRDLSGDQQRSGVIALASSKWPQATIYYDVDPALSPDIHRPIGDPEYSQGDRVSNAIAKWQAATPMRFVQSSTASNRVHFARSLTDCNSQVGMVNGVQTVNLNDTCYQSGAVHEIGHALGLFHEHQRSDRDLSITVNACVAGNGNYDRELSSKETNVGAFDFNSIMLYTGCNACSATNPAPVMIRKSTGLCFGQPQTISAGDVQGVKYVYGTWHATDIGAPGRDFAAGSAGVLYGLQPDGNGVWKFSAGSWTFIGGAGSNRLYAGGTNVYRTATNNDIYMYTSGTTWTKVGSPGMDIAVSSGGTLYALASDGSGVYQYTGTGQAWTGIGAGGTHLYAGGSMLYKTVSNGDIYRYDGGSTWTRVGAPGRSFAVDRQGRLYATQPDGQGVWMYSGSGAVWNNIGAASNGVFAGDSTVFSINPAGEVWKYNGTPQSWTHINGPATKVYASGSLVAAVAVGTGELFSYAP
ncbi:MAG: M12 family metallopeptidase [Polyangiaceae bacterium]